MACGGDDDSAGDDSDGGTASGDAGDPADGGGGENVDGGSGLCSQYPQPTGPDSPCPDPCDACEGGVCTVDCGQGSCNAVQEVVLAIAHTRKAPGYWRDRLAELG